MNIVTGNLSTIFTIINSAYLQSLTYCMFKEITKEKCLTLELFVENVTKTIGRLLDGYDIRLRPNFGGE
jgi:hypothetical protein